MAVGFRPKVALAEAAGPVGGWGIHVDDRLRSSAETVFAPGECVEHDGTDFGLVAPVYDQAKVLAATLTGEAAAFRRSALSTKLKVTGCDLFSADDFAEGEGREDIVFRDPARGVYKRLVIGDGRLIGAVLYGGTAHGDWFVGLIRDGTDIGAMRETLIFGPAYQDGAAAVPLDAVAALSADAENCGCNGVCKDRIAQAVEDGAVTLGKAFVRPAVQPARGAARPRLHRSDRRGPRRLIKAKAPKSQPAVWQELGWTTPDDRHQCRPVINF